MAKAEKAAYSRSEMAAIREASGAIARDPVSGLRVERPRPVLPGEDDVQVDPGVWLRSEAMDGAVVSPVGVLAGRVETLEKRIVTIEERLETLAARGVAGPVVTETDGNGSLRKCINCGAELPPGARKDRLTCKAACRLEWWRKSQREKEVKA